MEALLKDLRYNARTLLRSPGYTAAAVLTLMLGIGATGAIFSLADAVLVRPLPYPEPERLVMVWNTAPEAGFDRLHLSEPELLDYIRGLQGLEHLSGFSSFDANLSGTGEPERIAATRASASLLSALGVRPVLGRVFLPEEDRPGRDKVAILGHGLWQRRFGSDAGIVGRTILLNAESYTVVGVAPPGFDFPEESDLWVPLGLDPAQPEIRGARSLRAVARLEQGVTLEEARAEASLVARRLQEQYPDEYPADSGWNVLLVSLHEQQVGEVRTAVLVLFAAVGLVLLIACVNVTNLSLARLQARHQEVTIRTALGAGRKRLLGQFLTEGLLLGLVGGALGLLLASWGLRALVLIAPEGVPRLDEVELDLRALLFMAAASLLSGLVVSLVPALRASRTRLNEALKDGGRAGGGPSRWRFQRFLVAFEVAMAAVLLISSGLLIKNFVRLQQSDPGFNPNGLLTLEIALPESRYSDGARIAAFYGELRERLGKLPGVESVGMAQHLPLGRTGLSGPFHVEGRDPDHGGVGPESHWNWADPGYFQTLGIPLLKGRGFTPQDRDGSLPVVVVDQRLAEKVWPGEDPLGKRIRLFGSDSNPWLAVVGVVGHIQQSGLDASALGQLYLPHAQEPAVSRMYVALRTSSDPAALVPMVRREVLAVDPDQPVDDVLVMTDRISESLSSRRFAMFLLSLFAAIALVLAAVGIYGVMAYSVTQRNREIGVRVALGAQPSDVRRLVIGQGMLLAAIGLAVGLPLAFAATRLLESLLYQVSARDPLVFGVVPVLLASVALLANYLPARRATGVDPIIALRHG